MPRRFLALALLPLAAACARDQANPFGATASRPVSADAVLMFASGSWAAEPGHPRELLALSADGTKLERLTNCAQASSQPCNFVSFAPSPERGRIAAIRSVAGADPAASALHFMDLNRSVEKLLFPLRRVSGVDWSPDGSALLYVAQGQSTSGVSAAAADEDLFFCEPNGASDQNVTQTPTVRERAVRWDPSSRTAVYERIDESGVSRIYRYQTLALTTGPASGPALPGTPYVVGGDADPAYSPDGTEVAFRRLTGLGNGGLGAWDLMAVGSAGGNERTIVAGGAHCGAPDWGRRGILYVETDALRGESRLVVVQPDGSGRTLLRTEKAAYGMTAPRWLPGS